MKITMTIETDETYLSLISKEALFMGNTLFQAPILCYIYLYNKYNGWLHNLNDNEMQNLELLKVYKVLHNLACKGCAYLLIRELKSVSPLYGKNVSLENVEFEWFMIKNGSKTHGICHLLIREFYMMEFPYK
ncbi:Hypothetical_protein [Hexamita inflata]|uniref:Hypothetical_protein n=1 Tax=Hexamita inflata TaxID=28002 RepID=A0AA86TQN0_9EUKA|nr:Hypothetical protein HINF_LOCUS12390 [Hexamita inflata]